MEKTYLQQVGERLYQLRSHGLYSRRELAERAGVSIYAVKSMELGKQVTSVEDVVKICKVLGCSMDYVFTGEYGLAEFAKTNQKLLNIDNLRVESLQKMTKAFWSTCPGLLK